MLDHRYYPHIIEEIWSCMTFADVAVARNVCQAWRKRADELLLPSIRQVTLTLVEDEAPEGKSGKSRRSGRVTGRIGVSARDQLNSPDAYGLLCVLDYEREWGVYYEDDERKPWVTETVQELFEPWRAALDQTLVVDLVGFETYGKRLPRLPIGVSALVEENQQQNYFGLPGWDDWPEEPLFRWHNSRSLKSIPHLALNMDERVYFLDLHPGQPVPELVMKDVCQSGRVTLSIDCYSDPIAPVVNDQPAFNTAQMRFFSDPECIAIILNDKTNGAWRPRAEDAPLDQGLLYNYAQTMGPADRAVSIVGLELFFDSETDLKTYQSAYREEWDRASKEAKLDFPGGGGLGYGLVFRFYTHAEYRSSSSGVGEGQYRIQNCR